MGSEGLQDHVFTRLFEAAEIARFSRKEVAEYEDSLKAFRDWYSVMKTNFDKGVKQGIEQEKKSIARQMKADGVPLQSIARYTGLSEEEIAGL